MSSNLGRTDCPYCNSDVIVTGVPKIRGYYHVVAADAECSVCKAQYAAWVGDRNGTRPEKELTFHDLSFRSTFNDEPGEADKPPVMPQTFRVVVIDGKQSWFPRE